MLSKMQIILIAIACHNANKAYCESIGDTSQLPWEEAPEWQRKSAINGVEFHLRTPNAKPEDSHNSWLKEKEADGWKYGPVKDVEKKEHPCFVPYEQLPQEQKFKDALFILTFKSCKSVLETAFTPKEHFTTIEEGSSYGLPNYEVVDGVGIVELESQTVISFVRGSKLGNEKVEKRTGILHEHLLAVMIADLQLKNKLVPSREGSLTITALQDALHWQRERQIDRTKRNVVGTYKA